MRNNIQREIAATFSDDTKNYHRFDLDEGQDVKGVIYLCKDKPVSNTLVIHLRTKAEAEAESKKQG